MHVTSLDYISHESVTRKLEKGSEICFNAPNEIADSIEKFVILPWIS